MLATRKLPARLSRDCRATLSPEDRLYSTAELIAAATGHDALLVSPTERMSAEVFVALLGAVRAVATFSVGFEHIDLAAARSAASS
ncbi:MAG: hypothetical protein AB7S71_03585 [Dongiaceae bacterium]